ncbi:prepilin-type N-terminal cleavage/methylation domain-containing protein [Methylotenera sp.]|uniref:prepilin-type N-terminal cleavage/methylation domain-containing protein n=1 Tax=Methylotenera sp. TaxID=2051956 RepID=UPI00271A5764|nr:prepilin-type N-terminal cleavage/methylation domain-containing protein [Methylotenera sp.]MDO9205934.1 prepilin-type N-terminal cleavage/methylation domain-containing protein [Methylotenera sp.]
MKKQQEGYTIIELAIVLVIIGLLLGGVLKGQELINSAKVKNMVSDFKNTQVYIYGYQDKYRALPGDDANAVAHLGAAAIQIPVSATGAGNAVISGAWNGGANGTLPATESGAFWQHVRLAGLAPGPTSGTDANYYPTNADGGRIGVQSVSGFSGPTGLNGAYVICSAAILGRFAKQIDITLDDGETSTGSVRTYKTGETNWSTTTGAGAVDDSTTYNVCMAF